MPPRQDLLEEIRQALGQAVSPSLTTHSDLSDIYEGYIFVLLLQAARIEGAQVAFSSIQGGAANQFVFRTSPGYLNSQRQNYGYAEIHFPRCPTLEAHLGVRVAGHYYTTALGLPFTTRLSGCLQELQGTYPYMTTSGIPVERTAA
jgi:hypothetical protein